MIINALSEAYDRLCSNSSIEIARDGYSFEKVPYIAVININGKLTDLISNTQTIFVNGKKKNEVKKEKLPERISPRTSVTPNFLCDTFSYMFGLEMVDDNKNVAKGKIKVLMQTEKAKKSFEFFKKRIYDDIKDLSGDISKAILNFYENWKPENETQNELFYYKDSDGNKKLKDLSGNIVFAVNSVNFKTIDDAEILSKWEKIIQKGNRKISEKEIIAQCCISGRNSVIARTHISIKGVKGAQTSGAAIVTYNCPAFESYNKSQSYNGPVSETIMKRYTAALNYFLQNGSKNKITIANDTLVFWAESENEDYTDDIWDLLGIKQTETTEEATESKVLSALNQIRNGQPPNSFFVDDGTIFHILILSPNAARISIRRYYNKTFGVLRDNVLQHYKDMMLFNPKEVYKPIPFWRILDATVSSAISGDRTNNINPSFAGSLFESAFNNYQYPSALFAEMIARVKTDNVVTDDKLKTSIIINLTNTRTAFIKAYIVRKDRIQNKKEEITLELNKENQNEGYVLGRLFAVMEKAQQDAIPGINSTIKDRYFTSACSTPSTVFPSLLIGYQNHVSKLDKSGIRYEKLIDEIILKLPGKFPKQLDLDGQGRFILGYYQQRADLWKKQDSSIQNEIYQEEK